MSSSYELFDSAVEDVKSGNIEKLDEFTLLDFLGKLQASPQKNITFFLGAGFSKSWNEKYPNGNELFAISKEQAEKLEYNFVSIAKSVGINWLSEEGEWEEDWQKYEAMAKLFPSLGQK